jgi:protein TonB
MARSIFFRLQTNVLIRLLFMGTLTTPEYGSVDNETLSGKTEEGGFKHNRGVGRETGSLPFQRQAKRPEATEPAAIMPNDLLIQPETESQAAKSLAGGVELDLTFGVPVEEKSILVDLYENIRDIFFPPKLPPLQLTSKPIPVTDPMVGKRNPWAVAASTVLNGGILALLLFAVVKPMIEQKKPKIAVTPIELSEYKAPKAEVAAGGGGGSPDKIEANKGRIPPRAETPVVTPKVEMPPTPTINVQPDIVIPDNPDLSIFGVSKSPNVTRGSSGNGSGIGIGSGNGDGYGQGSGGNIGGGVYRVGGDVSEPIPIYDPNPDFSDEARRAKYQGVVLVGLIVDAQGNPQNVFIVRSLGMGLDEKALESVRTYKFKPAKKYGKPVAVRINVEVNFRLY